MLRISEDLNDFSYIKTDRKDIFTALERRFVKMFDLHYLQYISYRKQRDFIITNYFYQFLLKISKVDKKIINSCCFTDLVDLSNGISFDNVLQFNQNDLALNLERKISILKTFDAVLNDFKKIFIASDMIKSINTKIKKVISLSDESFVSRITDNESIKNKIISKIGVIKKYDEILISELLYNSLKKEIDLICQSVED